MATYCVGLTGGVASGKSEVASRFAAHGVFVVDADLAAREAVAPDSPGLSEIVARFGTAMLDASGALDRAAMRRHVFADPDARRQLEAIVHPRVREALEAACHAASSPYAIAAIPLLAESGGREAYPWLDRILVVDATLEHQRDRLLRRDGIDVDLAERMIAAQAGRLQRLALADDILVNAGALEVLDAQVADLDRQYRRLAATIA